MESQNRGRKLGRPKTDDREIPTREAILQVATRLYIENGFQKVSIDDVAKKAGMTKATVYYYFNSKAELFKEAMVALMGRIRQRIIHLMGSDKPLYDRLMDVSIAHLRATTTLDLEGYMRESKTSLSDEQIEEMKEAEEKMFESIEQGFIKAVSSGEISEVNAKFAAHSYLALIRVGNYKQPDGTSIFKTIDESATNILNVFWRGFFGKGADEKPGN